MLNAMPRNTITYILHVLKLFNKEKHTITSPSNFLKADFLPKFTRVINIFQIRFLSIKTY